MKRFDVKMFFEKNAKKLLLLGLCAVGVLLVCEALSSKSSASATLSYDGTAYRQEQEQKLETILTGMDGVGSCRVMMTVSEGSETVYAKDVKSGVYGQTSEYITVSGKAGDDLVTVVVKAPKVTGVAVVCQGGGNVSVRNEITALVSKLYGLSSAEIHVSKMK